MLDLVDASAHVGDAPLAPQGARAPWDAGRAMCTATADDIQGLERINVFAGQRRLTRYQTPSEPVILHFHFHAQDEFPYLRELARLRLGPRWGRGIVAVLAALPAHARARARYLARRIAQRIRARGVLGIVPERLELAWKRRFRRAT